MRNNASAQTTTTNALRAVFCASVLLLTSFDVLAGRPLTVDDADTEDEGAGHVEIWAAREVGRVTTYNVSPAYGVFDGLEVSALFTRDQTTPATAAALQAKWRITAGDEGCNLGLAAGATRTQGLSATARNVNGIVTCSSKAWGSVHVNAGGLKPAAGNTVWTWGLAHEREVLGLSLSLEWYGQQGQKPVVQTGLRKDVAKNLQLDGSIGRADRETIFSAGLTLRF
jgi:hypothetical protein